MARCNDPGDVLLVVQGPVVTGIVCVRTLPPREFDRHVEFKYTKRHPFLAMWKNLPNIPFASQFRLAILNIQRKQIKFDKI